MSPGVDLVDAKCDSRAPPEMVFAERRTERDVRAEGAVDGGDYRERSEEESEESGEREGVVVKLVQAKSDDGGGQHSVGGWVR